MQELFQTFLRFLGNFNCMVPQSFSKIIVKYNLEKDKHITLFYICITILLTRKIFWELRKHKENKRVYCIEWRKEDMKRKEKKRKFKGKEKARTYDIKIFYL